MKKLLFLVFLLSVTFAFSQHLVQPDTLWTYGPANFTSYPAVHPNGNVLVRIGHDVHELNGLTGELIRKIYIPTDANSGDRIEVSTDGTKLIAGRYYVDYATGELLNELPDFYRVVFLNPRSDIILYAPHWNPDPKGFKLFVLDLKDSSTTEIFTQFFPTAINISNDGRYFAIGCQEYEPEERTHFYLYDAQTLKLINELENVPSTGRQIEFIMFSENAKYVGYGHLLGGANKATLFSCPDHKLIKEFNTNSLGLIMDKYAWVLGDGSFLWEIETGKIIYETKDYVSNYPVFNKYNNSILVFARIEATLVALDLNAILTGVDFNDNINQDSIIITYVNGYLQISNFVPTSLPSDIKIFDLNGKIIYQSVQPIIVDKLQLRIGLQSGVYILQLKSGDKQYSHKFIVSN